MPTSGADNLGRRIASQLVLAIAAQRGSLRFVPFKSEGNLTFTLKIERKLGVPALQSFLYTWRAFCRDTQAMEKQFYLSDVIGI